MTNQTEQVFVYGSLKRGYELHYLLDGARWLGEAATTPQYRLVDCGEYPGLVRSRVNGVSVRGELYQVDVECLQSLDEAEGVHLGLYSREHINLTGIDCLEAMSTGVWAYFYLLSTENLRECGESWP